MSSAPRQMLFKNQPRQNKSWRHQTCPQPRPARSSLRPTLNILEAAQTDMIVHFGRGFSLAQDAFTGLDVRREPGKGPVLNEALGYLECQVVGRASAGDHDLFFGRVLAGA